MGEPVLTRSGKVLPQLKIFVGYDPREDLAYEVCRHSILKHATFPVEVIPIKQADLRKAGLYWRTRDPTESTEFSFSRFLTPFLAGFDGWSMFVDCDFLYTADLRELAEFIDDKYAVMCVKHDYKPKQATKMDGIVQTTYPRKNFQFQCLEKNHLQLLCQWILSFKPSVSISVDLNGETIMGGRVPAGWPLGLETLNLRMSIMDAIRSTDPHPSLLATPSFSSLSSSDFDTESSISFFPDRSITLGSLIGIPSDRFGRHGSSCVHPEDGTQMGRSGMVAGRPKNYWGARRWKSFMGCMYLHSRVDSHPSSLGHFLKEEKKAGASVIGATRDEKVYINIMYEESDAVLSDTNSLFLDPHTNHSSRMGSRRLPSLDLAMIQEESPSRLSNIDGLKDWSSAKGGLRVTGGHNRAQSLHSCLPFVSNILGKMSSSRASLCSGKISHL